MKAESTKISQSITKIEANGGIDQLRLLQKETSNDTDNLTDRIAALEKEMRAKLDELSRKGPVMLASAQPPQMKSFSGSSNWKQEAPEMARSIYKQSSKTN